MANPMQRRAKNAFLLGFLIATIIMALVVAGLIYKITETNERMDELKSKQKEISVWEPVRSLKNVPCNINLIKICACGDKYGYYGRHNFFFN